MRKGKWFTSEIDFYLKKVSVREGMMVNKNLLFFLFLIDLRAVHSNNYNMVGYYSIWISKINVSTVKRGRKEKLGILSCKVPPY